VPQDQVDPRERLEPPDQRVLPDPREQLAQEDQPEPLDNLEPPVTQVKLVLGEPPEPQAQ